MQMGGAQPFQAYGPNYFNLPPAGTSDHHVYPSMDPSAMGTRIPAPGQPPKRPAESDVRQDDAQAKRPHQEDVRAPMLPAPQMAHSQGFVPMGPPPQRFGMQPVGPPGAMPPRGEEIFFFIALIVLCVFDRMFFPCGSAYSGNRIQLESILGNHNCVDTLLNLVLH